MTKAGAEDAVCNLGRVRVTSNAFGYCKEASVC